MWRLRATPLATGPRAGKSQVKYIVAGLVAQLALAMHPDGSALAPMSAAGTGCPTSGGVLGTQVADQAYDVIGHQAADGAA